MTITTVSATGETLSKTFKRDSKGEKSGTSDVSSFYAGENESYDDDDDHDDEYMALDDIQDYKLPTATDHSLCSEDLPSLHSIKQTSSVAGWEAVRSSLLDVCIEINAMPACQECTSCSLNLARFRCLRCGPNTYYCDACLDIHTQRCVYHCLGQSCFLN